MKKADLSNLALIIILGVVLYLNVIPAPFHLDDYPHLVENPHIKNLADPVAIWNHWPSRIFGFLTFAGNYALGRLHPAGYRMVNILIHLAGGVFAYLLTFRLVGIFRGGDNAGRRTAFWTALIFLCHPVQTQAVTYIIQRFASLAGVLSLASILCYLTARSMIDRGESFRSPRHLWIYGLGLFCALLAMTTKESAAVIPVLILSIEVLSPQRSTPLRKRLLYYLPYGLTILVVPVLSLYMASGRGSHPFYYQRNVGDGGRMYIAVQDLYVESRFQYLLTQLHALLVYLRLCLFPFRQSIYYDLPVSRSLFSPGTYPSLFVVFGSLIFAFRFLRRRPLITLAVLWFFLNLLPSSSVMVVWPFASEHHLYLPIFSLALVLGLFLSSWGEGRSKDWIKILGWLLVFALSLFTILRNQLWGDTYQLWKDALRSAPEAPNVYNALAGALVQDGRYREGEAAALRAMEINPRLNAYHNLWAAYFNRGDIPAAELTALRHRELFPGDQRGGVNLGMTFLKQEDYGAGREVLQETVDRYPDSAPAHYWLGVSLYELNQDTEAIEEFVFAIDLNPDYPAAYDYLGRLYDRRSEPARALEIYSRGTMINPDSLVLNYNLGMLAWRQGRLTLAEKHLRQCRKLTDDRGMNEILSGALEQLLNGSSFVTPDLPSSVPETLDYSSGRLDSNP